MAQDDRLVEASRELRDDWGIGAARARAVVQGLAGDRWRSVSELVAESALPRRLVEEIVTRFRPWLEARDDQVRLGRRHRDALLDLWRCPAAAEDPGGVQAVMTSLLDGLPPGDPNLDHVRATPATAVARARFLADTYDLDGASVLCLGDHDLTSLALTQVCPSAEIAVVDVDERVLEYIGRAAASRGWPVRTLYADLRVELPRSVRQSCDLVFTDPPYTPGGVQLFLARALAALRPGQSGRVVFCYGFGDRHPALGLDVQSVFHGLNLVAEAILPRFNRYLGAEALGGASSLYVCRPTRKTWPAMARASAADPRIYSRGESAVTAERPEIPPEVHERVREQGPATLVGDGWPPGLADRPALPLGRYLDELQEAGGKPPFTHPAHGDVVAISLHPHLGAYLPRVLLASTARRLLIVAPAGAPVTGRLTGLRYELAGAGGGDPALLVAERVTPEASARLDRVLSSLLERGRATLGSAWREALIAVLAAEGLTVTRNQARAAVAGTSLGGRWSRSHLTELPLDRLQALPDQVGLSLELLADLP